MFTHISSRRLAGAGCLTGIAVASFTLFLATPAVAEGRKVIDDPAARETKKDSEIQVEVRFTDQSVLKLSIREERIDVKTDYGKLSIPVADVRRIEFGLRIPEEVQRRVDAAIADLGGTQFRQREAASAILLGLREKAYGAVLKATKHQDMEIANRAEELIKKLKETVPAELLQLKDFDVIHTESSRIAGRIEAAALRANTIQFGEVQLKLADVYSLTLKGVEVIDPDSSNAVAAPSNMIQFQNDIGKTFTFKVTGTNNGSLWGTDSYTTDSTIGMAAVHCGLLQPGQTGTIKVTMLPGQAVYQGVMRNGVTSSGYGQYPASYRVHK